MPTSSAHSPRDPMPAAADLNEPCHRCSLRLIVASLKTRQTTTVFIILPTQSSTPNFPCRSCRLRNLCSLWFGSSRSFHSRLCDWNASSRTVPLIRSPDSAGGSLESNVVLFRRPTSVSFLCGCSWVNINLRVHLEKSRQRALDGLWIKPILKRDWSTNLISKNHYTNGKNPSLIACFVSASCGLFGGGQV